MDCLIKMLMPMSLRRKMQFRVMALIMISGSLMLMLVIFDVLMQFRH